MLDRTVVTGRVAVTFEAPNGTDSLVLDDGAVAEFGRGAACAIRFGYAPLADTAVPKVAGRLVVANRRAFIEGPDNTARAALEVLTEGAPPVLVAGGAGYAPPSAQFRIKIHGSRAWYLSVVVRHDSPTAIEVDGDLPTMGLTLSLTEMQRKVLKGYLEPFSRGRLEPATHAEVAAALGYHPNSAREALYAIWLKMFEASIPMLDIAEKRIAVVEAVRAHRLLS